MKCKKCNEEMKRIEVDVEGAKNKAVSYQCNCGGFEFEDTSSQKVITELRAKENIKPKFVSVKEAQREVNSMLDNNERRI